MLITHKSYRYWFSVGYLFAALSLILRGDETSLPAAISNTSILIRDIEGKEKFPFQINEAKAGVLFFLTRDCPISNAYSPEMIRLKEEYEPKGFTMMLVYVDPDVTEAELRKHVREYGLSGYPVITDKEHVLVRETGATVTPEVVVVLGDGTISYRGRIDNMYPALGQRRRVITEKDLRNALNSIIENKPVQVSRTQAVGCFIPNL